MHATLARADLARAAGWVAKAIPAKPQIPILAGMRIEFRSDNQLVLAAYDYDRAVTRDLDATVDGTGVAIVPGHALAGFSAAAKGRDARLEVDGQRLPGAEIVQMDLPDKHVRISPAGVRASAGTCSPRQRLGRCRTRWAPAAHPRSSGTAPRAGWGW